MTVSGIIDTTILIHLFRGNRDAIAMSAILHTLDICHSHKFCIAIHAAFLVRFWFCGVQSSSLLLPGTVVSFTNVPFPNIPPMSEIP